MGKLNALNYAASLLSDFSPYDKQTQLFSVNESDKT